MIIDILTDKDVPWVRYESDILPRVGETVSTLNPEVKEFIVLSIDHLVAPRSSFTDDMYQQLVTITAKEN